MREYNNIFSSAPLYLTIFRSTIRLNVKRICGGTVAVVG